MSLDQTKVEAADHVAAASHVAEGAQGVQSHAAAAFLKALSHEGRLRILFILSEGERSVSELERRLGSRQAAVSQQLARLRIDGLVASRRMGKTIIYRLNDPRVGEMLRVMSGIFAKAH